MTVSLSGGWAGGIWLGVEYPFLEARREKHHSREAGHKGQEL